MMEWQFLVVDINYFHYFFLYYNLLYQYFYFWYKSNVFLIFFVFDIHSYIWLCCFLIFTTFWYLLILKSVLACCCTVRSLYFTVFLLIYLQLYVSVSVRVLLSMVYVCVCFCMSVYVFVYCKWFLYVCVPSVCLSVCLSVVSLYLLHSPLIDSFIYLLFYWFPGSQLIIEFKYCRIKFNLKNPLHHFHLNFHFNLQSISMNLLLSF